MARQTRFAAEEEKDPSPPTMSRSRNQLASAYAPGAFFTFEGGLGSCVSIPDLSSTVDAAPLSEETKNQIFSRLREVWQSWFSRAYALNTAGRQIEARQCVEEALLAGGMLSPLGGHQVEFVSPLKMGYSPAPLTFVCNRCQTFRRFDTTDEVFGGGTALNRVKCPALNGRASCQWRQLDVIFVHWSGTWMPATPGRWEWNDKTKDVWLSGEQCSLCRGTDFKLNTASPRIGEWFFYCGNPRCGHKPGDEWRQNDEYTTRVFREASGKRNSERRMEPISYRASSTFYPQSEQFVLFAKKDQGLLALLEPDQQAGLTTFIASKYRFGTTALTRDEMRDALLRAGHSAEWQSYENFEKVRTTAATAGDTAVQALMDKELGKLVTRWATSEPPLLPNKAELPSRVVSEMTRRADYTSKYDPFVLAVEHEALFRSKLTAPAEGGHSPFVRFNHLDNDLAPKNLADKARQEQETTTLMGRLGLIQLGLVREFELCRFTHGYSRVSAVPTMEKRNQLVPVRLRLFDPLRTGKRPVYVVTQGNEALYCQLDPALVYAWLKQIGIPDLPPWNQSETVTLGGRLLEAAQPFGRYFSLLKEDEASTYRYVYTLLHTYAHLFAKNIAELSGLDLGSMSEYLFPADLAFVVYRNGTTMDLGNLSSLWRNENTRFLRRILEPSTHRCNSGSLCDAAGGACPDCIMVPETSCIAQNRLLSRAVLTGGQAPREDKTHEGQRIHGFLELINEAAPT